MWNCMDGLHGRGDQGNVEGKSIRGVLEEEIKDRRKETVLDIPWE